jgi:hypothetical protein
MKLKATTREPSPTAKMLLPTKKSKSLEFPKTKSSRPTTNVWDVIDKQPEIAKKIVDTKAGGKKKKTATVLQKTHKALKDVVERKEKLYQILKELEPVERMEAKKKKLKKKKKVTIPTALSSDGLDKSVLVRSLSPMHFTKPFQELVAKLQESGKEDAVSQIAIPEQDFVAKFAEPPAHRGGFGTQNEGPKNLPIPEPQKLLMDFSSDEHILPTKPVPVENLEHLPSSETATKVTEVPIIPSRIMEMKSEQDHLQISKYDSLVDLVESYDRPFKESQLSTVPRQDPEAMVRELHSSIHIEPKRSTPITPHLSISQIIIEEFSKNLERAPQLIRDFVSVVPFEKENGGLSLSSQGDVIHYGTRLEAKILEMMKLYNNYLKELGM